MDVNAGEESKRLLLSQNTERSSSEEEWSDEDSEESYYSDSDSSVPEWEPSIHDVTGELLYIDCHPFVTQNPSETPPKQTPLQPFSKDQLRRSTRGKFLRLIRRRDSQRARRSQKAQDVLDTTTKVKFQDSQEGEEKEVLLKIARENCCKDLESLLGINFGTLSDGNRVMVAGFLPESPAKHEKNIKIGDWLKSVNNIAVTYQNLNTVLDKLDKDEVLLKLQRVAGVEVTKDPPIHEINCQSKFVRELVEFQKENFERLTQFPIGVVFINTENLSENSTDSDIIYSYPEKSLLIQTRGIFITLNHLINEVTKTTPHISSLFQREQLLHVTYTNFGCKLFLLMFPDCYVCAKEALFLTLELTRILSFLFGSVEATDWRQMEHFFARLFARVLNGKVWGTTSDALLGTRKERVVDFEEVLPGAVSVPLSNEAFMQVDDALTELEASDYRDWNEEPLDCQRLFTILGSALYHQGYLLASHLMHEDLKDIHMFCRQFGFFHLSRTEPIKTLIYWKEVFPFSCRNQTQSKIPTGKRYLLLVGSRKDLLAVIMEAGGCTEPAEDNMAPDAFYVEEVQATLAHIQELGIPELAERFLSSNPGAQVTIPETSTKRKSDFLGKSVAKKPEVMSILKRRNSDQFVFLEDDRKSEDSESDQSRPSRNEDSDEDGDGSQSSFDITELRQSILSESEEIQQLTVGKENVLFHFLQFDETEGVLISPPECRVRSQTLDVILESFRSSAQKIHAIFQNTMRFKNMPAQDMAKSVMNKSLIAIKEHGVLFECPFFDDLDKRNKIRFWVLGRLFYMPHPREVYVCYQDTVPQNLIEIAFKIDLNTMN